MEENLFVKLKWRVKLTAGRMACGVKSFNDNDGAGLR